MQARNRGGSAEKRCPHSSTRAPGPHPAARYSAICSHGVAASAVQPKFVGPAQAAMCNDKNFLSAAELIDLDQLSGGIEPCGAERQGCRLPCRLNSVRRRTMVGEDAPGRAGERGSGGQGRGAIGSTAA